MRKRRIIALLLALILALPGGVGTAAAAGPNPALTWFYDQLSLSPQAQRIYDAILGAFEAGRMNDGVTPIDLIEAGATNETAVQAYLDGDRTLFNDFAAAKDAFDLEHPEAWFIDSSDLSFRVTKDGNNRLYASIGPGREADYYVNGVAGAGDVRTKTDALKDAIGSIVSGAESYDTDYKRVKYAHNQITRSISYRFEQDCARDENNVPVNAGFIRTAYALVTHEGVCEGYARSFQMAMNELGIPCVLIHGVQTSGTPEDHMWTAVQLEDGEWYVVDPTWDDPVLLDNGNVVTTGVDGEDGGERENYLCVGQDVTGANWKPSGYVSTGAMEFAYPEIALYSYGRSVLEQGRLKVVSAADKMEGIPSTVYHVSFDGMGLRKAAEKKYYFLVKMYDVNPDGSMNAFDDWYYSAHGLKAQGGDYFYDTDDYLVYNVSNCEYVEFAITTKAPPVWETDLDYIDPTKDGYYKGDYSDIIAESGLIYNEYGGYEQPPYVKNASPAFTFDVRAGKEYNIHIEFTDALLRPDEERVATTDPAKLGDLEKAMGQDVVLDYDGFTYSWGMNGDKSHNFSEKPAPQNVRFTCTYHNTTHTGGEIDADCRITAVDYDFTSSKMWYDDSIRHEFYLTGLVGAQSYKLPITWSYIFHNTYPFTTCPLCSPFKWNSWGQPQALNNPYDLDLAQLTTQGVNEKDQKSLEKLRQEMNLDPYDMNGRLMLVVENLDQNRTADDSMAKALEQGVTDENGDTVQVPTGAIKAKSLFEIDFARVCGRTVVMSGQSVRVCLGFPEGIDASMTGIVFKAYHFTRDDDTGAIVSVEEIPCTVTPYGLVVECMSFSPFEVVALDANVAGLEEDTSRPLMVMIEGRGSVTSNVAGEGNVISLKENESRTFTIRADDGYAIDTVSFSNEQKSIEAGARTVTISYDDLTETGGILSVTFAAESVKQAETDLGRTAAAPAPCVHEHENIRYEGGKEATCEEEGASPTATCGVCHTVLRVSEPILATGHKYENGKCVYCGKTESGTSPSPAPTPTPTPGPTPGSVPVSSGGSSSTGSGVGRPATGGGSTTVGVAVTAATSGSTASAMVDNSAMNRAVNSAVAEASRQGAAPVVEVTVNIPSAADSLNVSLPTVSLRTLARAANSSLVISSSVADVTLDHVALGTLTSSVSGSIVTLKVAPVAAAALSDAQREAMGGASVVDVSLFSGNVAIHDFGSGTITVSLPYTLGSGQRGSDIVVYSMDDYGRLTPCATSCSGGKVTFAAGHLSKFVIGAGAANTAGGAFVDVDAGAYYAAAVAWAAETGVTRGTDDTHFSPNYGCTRAQFVTFLWRAAGSPAPASYANPFSDVSVAGYADYYDAILWAVERGIALGTGDGTTFSPDAGVLRAQAVTFMHRYARQAGIATAIGTPSFADVTGAGTLAPYYDAIGWAAANGITNGNGGAGAFGPMEVCNRGMMITFLHRLFTGATA